MKKIKKWKEWSKKQKISLLVIICAVILGIAGIMIYFTVIRNQSISQSPGSMTLDNGMVQASGTTATAILTEELDIESLDTTLYIEDIYLSSARTQLHHLVVLLKTAETRSVVW